jgi:enamine deaminase RidA (YjgF/YER057c/UK114 family)
VLAPQLAKPARSDAAGYVCVCDWLPHSAFNYSTARRWPPQRLIGNMLYVSGSSARPRVIGKVPDDVSFDEAKAAARSTGISLLSIVKGAIGSLDGVKRVVKSLGMVNGAPDFGEHPAVIDGYAELMTEVFGEDGWGARSAVGMGSLPLGITVEIEAIFEVEDGYGEGSSTVVTSTVDGRLEASEARVATLEQRVEELEDFVDNLVEEVRRRRRRKKKHAIL